MKPEQFIREFGEKKAREVVEGMPECANHYKFSEYASIDQYYSIHTIPLKWNNYSKTWYQLRKKPKDLVDLIDLKRLVESVDLVNSLGGIKAARSEAHKDCFVYNQPLLAAIAAYESIYGGGHV